MVFSSYPGHTTREQPTHLGYFPWTPSFVEGPIIFPNSSISSKDALNVCAFDEPRCGSEPRCRSVASWIPRPICSQKLALRAWNFQVPNPQILRYVCECQKIFSLKIGRESFWVHIPTDKVHIHMIQCQWPGLKVVKRWLGSCKADESGMVGEDGEFMVLMMVNDLMITRCVAWWRGSIALGGGWWMA